MSSHLEAAGALAGVERHLRRFALGDAASWARLGVAAGASVALHALVVSRLEPSPVATRPLPPPSEVRFEVVRRAPLPPVAPPEPPRAPARIPARIKATPEPPKPVEPEPVPETPTPETPQPEPDLGGVTLSGDGPSAFVMPSGSGEARAGVLGALPARPVAPAIVAPKLGPKLVPLADLGTRPAPPSLAGALSKNYPAEARRRNIAGHARVRARIDPDGVPRALSVLEETFAGFGSACRQTLASSRWSPPRDHSGTAVASEVLYTCRFVIEP